MHCDAEAGVTAREAGGERDEDGAAAAPARLRGDLRFRARVVGAAGVALCVSLCVLAAAGPDGWGQPGELEQVRGGVRSWPGWPQCLSCACLRGVLRGRRGRTPPVPPLLR